MFIYEKEWELYESRRLAIMDYNTGMIKAREEGEALGEAKGRKKGERKKQLEIAKKLLKLGISIDKIEEATELTKEEIEELK